MNNREKICRRVALEFQDGNYVNLGIGMPTEVVNYLPEGVNIFLEAELGMLGAGPTPAPGTEDWHIQDAGGKPVSALPGASFFDSTVSFGMIRGGHLDITVMGGLQVDQEGNLANWMVPGKKVPGMGGAMDLTAGVKKVIIIMEHCTKTGEAKLVKRCTMPLTAKHCVDLLVTEKGVFAFTPEGVVLKELAQDVTLDELLACTKADLIIEKPIRPMRLA